MSLKVAIIADDLTGALDSAAPFAARGLRAVAALAPEALEEALRAGAEIVAVNTLTRHLSPAAAAAAAEQAAHQCLAAGARSLFKKIDSRLRGNACVEAVAVAAAVGAGGLVVAPAVPRQGRVVTGGAVRGAGVENADGIDIAALFGGAAAAGLELEFPDASTEEELDAVATSCSARAGRVVAVGAHGLASALARRLGPGSARQPSFVIASPVLVVVGSQDPATAAQVAALSGCPGLATVIEAPAGRLPARPPAANSPIIVLRSVPPADPEAEPGERFTESAASWVTVLRARTLLATGGDTAAALLRRLGCRVLAIGGEAAPGIPWSVTVTGMTLLSKSGGFGGARVLVDLAQALRNAMAR